MPPIRQGHIVIEQIHEPEGPELCEKCWHVGLFSIPLVLTIGDKVTFIPFQGCIECGWQSHIL